MKRLLLIAAALLACTGVQAYAAEPTKPAEASTLDTGKLTVLQLINIADALRQLGDYRDQRGLPVKVPFKFDGSTMMTFAIDISHADAIQKIYQDKMAALSQKEIGDRQQRLAALDKAATAETDPTIKKQTAAAADALRSEIATINQKINEQSAHWLDGTGGALLARIKLSELCMSVKVVEPCTVTNTIPPSLLSALVPIIDQ